MRSLCCEINDFQRSLARKLDFQTAFDEKMEARTEMYPAICCNHGKPTAKSVHKAKASSDQSCSGSKVGDELGP